MKEYEINEIFYSLQGEGYNTGTASVFIRFSGCNLRCSFCDTRHEKGTFMTINDIVTEVLTYPLSTLIVLTGGEPSLFIDEAFIMALKDATHKLIAIETNGTHDLPSGIDWVTLSPKQGFDGGDAKPGVVTECNELKVVYLGQDLSQYQHIKATYRYLQPCYTPDAQQYERNMQSCVRTVLNNPEWKLSLQVHRALHIR